MSLHSLETERNSILNRMQMSRSSYRHMLAGDDDDMHHAAAEARHASPSSSPHHPAYAEAHARNRFPRSATMKLLTRHPFACALAVAAIVVIGPRRIVRSALTGSSAATALTLRNKANIDMISRLLALVGQQYAQRSRARHPPR